MALSVLAKPVAIEPGPLAQALLSLANQHQVVILAPADLVKSYQCDGVNGNLTTSEALSRLLQFTALQFQQTEPHSFLIQANAGQPVTLEEVLVTADSETFDAARFRRQQLNLVEVLDHTGGTQSSRTTLADTLATLPGIAVNREAGEGQFLSIRGLGPAFQRVTLNGAPLANNENLRNSDISGSFFRFRSFSADLFQRARVYKNADPARPYAAAAHIDLTLPNPLQQPAEQQLQHWQYYDQPTGQFSPAWHWRYSDQNEGRDFGWSLTFSQQQRNTRFDRLQTFGFSELTLADSKVVRTPSSVLLTSEYEQRRRQALMMNLVWDVSHDWQVSLQGVHQSFDNRIAEHRLGFPLAANADALTAASSTAGDPPTEALPRLTSARFEDSGNISHDAEFSQQQHRNQFLRLASDAQLGDWQLLGSVSYAQANSDLKQPLQRIRSDQSLAAGDFYQIDLGRSPLQHKTLDAIRTSVDLNAAEQLRFRRYQIRPVYADDQQQYLHLQLNRPQINVTQWLEQSLSLGWSWQQHKHDYQRRDRQMELRPDDTVTPGFYRTQVGPDVFSELVNDAPGRWISPDATAFSAAFQVADSDSSMPPVSSTISARSLAANPDDAQRSFQATQQRRAYWLKWQFAGLTTPWTGFIGVRAEQIQQHIRGHESLLNAQGQKRLLAIQQQQQQTLWMPSLQLRLPYRQGVQLRFSLSQGYDLPSLSDITPAVIPNSALTSEIFNQGSAALEPGGRYSSLASRTAIAGNPTLKPVRSGNIDIAIDGQWRPGFSTRSSLFYKRLRHPIRYQDIESVQNFSVNSGDDIEVTVLLSQPQNLDQQTLWGTEQAFDWQIKNGYGLQVSINQIIRRRPATEPQGVADRNLRLTASYRDATITAQFSGHYHSRYRSNINTTLGTSASSRGADIYVLAGWLFDANASWHATDELQLTFAVNNVFNHNQAAVLERSDQFLQLQSAGRWLSAGIHARF